MLLQITYLAEYWHTARVFNEFAVIDGLWSGTYVRVRYLRGSEVRTRCWNYHVTLASDQLLVSAIIHSIKKSLAVHKIMALFRPAGTCRIVTRLNPTSQLLSSQQIRWTSQLNGEASAEPASRTNSSDYATPKAPDTSMIRQEDASEGAADHQLNYHVPIDHGTSWAPRNLFSFTTDASGQTLFPSPEAGHGWERGRKFSSCCSTFRCPSWPSSTDSSVGCCSSSEAARTPTKMTCHRIYRPAKTATQSGDWHGHHWRMDWDILSKGHRWENPLMGWQSSADSMQGTHINFKSKEDAIHFAEKQGYEYFVQEPNIRRILPKAYANNFIHSPTKLKHIRTKWGVVKFLYSHKRRK